MTCKDLAEIAAAWASVGGLVIAVGAGWIALLTYRGQLRHEADTHAHGSSANAPGDDGPR